MKIDINGLGDREILEMFEFMFKHIEVSQISKVASLQSHWEQHGLTDGQKRLFNVIMNQTILTVEKTRARQPKKLSFGDDEEKNIKHH